MLPTRFCPDPWKACASRALGSRLISYSVSFRFPTFLSSAFCPPLGFGTAIAVQFLIGAVPNAVTTLRGQTINVALNVGTLVLLRIGLIRLRCPSANPLTSHETPSEVAPVRAAGSSASESHQRLP